MKKLTIYLWVILLAFPMFAQDAYFSNIVTNAAFYNPAYTGYRPIHGLKPDSHGIGANEAGVYSKSNLLSGTHFIMNNRWQWLALNKQYNTYNAHFSKVLRHEDANKLKKSRHDLAMGFSATREDVLNFNTHAVDLMMSYKLDLVCYNVLFGVGVGYNILRINEWDNLLFGDEILNPVTFELADGSEADILERQSNGYFDVKAGLVLVSRLNDRYNYNIGVSLDHLTRPSYTFLESAHRYPMRAVANAFFHLYDPVLVANTHLVFGGYWEYMHLFHNAYFGADMFFKNRGLLTGVWYRSRYPSLHVNKRDALVFKAKYQWETPHKHFKQSVNLFSIEFSYDLSLSNIGVNSHDYNSRNKVFSGGTPEITIIWSRYNGEIACPSGNCMRRGSKK